MRRFNIHGTAAAALTTQFASATTLATSATLVGTTTGDSLAHKITVTGNAATNHSAKTITITGTYNGVVVTDTVSGPNGTATVTSTKYMDILTSVTIDSTAGADTFKIGMAVDSVSPWVHVARENNPKGGFGIGFGCQVTSGSPTFSVQHSHGGSDPSVAYTHSVVTAKTSNTEGNYTTPIEAFRLLWTAAGGVEMTGNWIA